MGVYKSGYVTNEYGVQVSGQRMTQSNPPIALDVERVADYRRWAENHRRIQAQMALRTAAATPVPNDDDADLAESVNTMNLRRRVVG